MKTFGAIPRRPDISAREFHDHYRHPHGTLGASMSTTRAYVQSHQIHSDLLDERQTYFEACAEVWFDSLEDAMNVGTEPVYAAHISVDEPLFVDMPRLRFLITAEEVLKSGPDRRLPLGPAEAVWDVQRLPTTIKLLQFIEEDGDHAWDGDDDFDLGERLGALRHVRCRPIPGAIENSFAIGVRELWWGSEFDLEAGVARDRAAWEELVLRPSRWTGYIARAERFI
ncbi:MAG: EthD domain-containing protein [Novosphingobium sp.]